jgi:hypothetical protein
MTSEEEEEEEEEFLLGMVLIDALERERKQIEKGSGHWQRCAKCGEEFWGTGPTCLVCWLQDREDPDTRIDEFLQAWGLEGPQCP